MIVNDFFQFLVVKRTTWEALNVDQWKKEATSIWSMKMETTAVIVERNILLKYICNVELNRQGIINNYCMRLSKISWFGSGFIIRSPSLFFDYWRSNLPFSRKSDGKKEKSVVSFTHGQNIICSQTLKAKTRLDDIAHEQNIISCRQLFEGYVVGFRQIMEEKFASNDKCRYCSFIQFLVTPSPRPGTFQALAVFFYGKL